jgi:hypothetical protein
MRPRDYSHLAEYLALLHAKGEGRTVSEMARDICGIDPVAEPARAKKLVNQRLRRAQWLVEHGRELLLGDAHMKQDRENHRKRVR